MKSPAVSPEWGPSSDAGVYGGYCPWMWFWCLLCVQSVEGIIRVSQTRLVLVCRVVTRVTPAWRVVCHRWAMVASLCYVLERVLPRVSFWIGIVSCCGGGEGVGCVPLVVAGAFTALILAVWPWPMEASSLAMSVMKGLWSVPVVVVITWLWVWSVMLTRCSWWGDFLWVVLGKMTKAITVITLCIGAVVNNMACLSTCKTYDIILHHVYCRGWHGSCNLLCNVELLH